MPNAYQSTHWTGPQIDQIYPVGSLYFSVNNTNPGTLFGGTWERIEDKFLLCAGSTYAPGTTGGAASHTSGGPSNNTSGGPSNNTSGGPSNNTSGSTAITVAQMPSHNHEMPSWMWAVSTRFNTGTYNIGGSGNKTGNAIPYNDNRTSQGQWVTSTGSGQGHTHTLSSHTHSLQSHTHSLQSHTHTVNTLPPYLAVYVWQRTA